MDNDHELEKYSRQIILNEVGPEGQQKLKKASVLIIGIGGLGSSVIQYLNAAGVGKIGIVDYDKVELSNLNRQLIYKNSDIGKSKVDVASNYISELNSSKVTSSATSSLSDSTGTDGLAGGGGLSNCSV